MTTSTSVNSSAPTDGSPAAADNGQGAVSPPRRDARPDTVFNDGGSIYHVQGRLHLFRAGDATIKKLRAQMTQLGKGTAAQLMRGLLVEIIEQGGVTFNARLNQFTSEQGLGEAPPKDAGPAAISTYKRKLHKVNRSFVHAWIGVTEILQSATEGH